MKTLIRISTIILMLVSFNIEAGQMGGPAPDIGAGKKRAAVCFACHNSNGISKIPETPHLAGQERMYLEKALRAYRDGQTRQDPIMNAMAKPLTDRDIVNIAAYFNLQVPMAKAQNASSLLETIERIKPVGNVLTEASRNTGTFSQVRSGEAVFNAACAGCHATGAGGAPKAGDTAAWVPRLAQGQETLVMHALQGINAMPAKGACMQCTDAEIQAAVGYIAEKSR